MIKKLQLRGISRTPSYHLTADGGCSESLNVQLDETEVSPILAPVNVTPDGADGTEAYIYIHKVGTEENYIYVKSGKIYAGTEGGPVELKTLSSEEEVVSVTSVGKILVIATTGGVLYVSYKDGTYLPLGSEIPRPVIRFDTKAEVEDVRMDFYKSYWDAGFSDRLYALTMLVPWNQEWWDLAHVIYQTKNGAYPAVSIDDSHQVAFDGLYENGRDPIDIATEYIWDEVREKVIEFREQKAFAAPVFIRTAVELYDGSYIYQSVPVLLGNGQNANIHLFTENGDSNSFRINHLFVSKIMSKATVEWDVEGWEDIIKSVSFFLSTDIEFPKQDSLLWGYELVSLEQGTTYALFRNQDSHDYMSDELRKDILSKINFYKVHSIPVSDFSGGSDAEWDVEPYSQDELVVKEPLPDDNLSNHSFSPIGGTLSYNMRAIMYGVRAKLYSGYEYIQGEVDVVESPEESLRNWKVKYFVTDDIGGSGTVLGRYEDGGTVFSNHEGSESGTYTRALGVLFYPDPKCTKAVVYDSKSNKYYSIPMQEHPGLNCSYALCDLSKEIIDGAQEVSGTDFDTESPLMSSDNILMMSEAYNPFVYQMVNRKSFGAKIVGVAPVTKALSTGQFGQFPLYVFTEEGIQAIGINADGSFGATSFVSRDVAYEGTVSPLDQAIVFTSARGVMLLVGSDIECISPFMNGRHEPLDEAVASLLENTAWADYVLDNDAPFMEFIKGARAAYDYAGKRLIFFSAEYAYQYVYCFGSKSWHKMFLSDAGLQFRSVLNSYPECLVAMSGKVMDFSTYLDASLEDDDDPSNDQEVLPGIIETRAFGLDADDSYKTIRRIRIRGNFTKGTVRYALLASPDGKDFRVLHSLRGPSWKYYKLAIFSKMRPTERISFVEIDYDVRFNDRIR